MLSMQTTHGKIHQITNNSVISSKFHSILFFCSSFYVVNCIVRVEEHLTTNIYHVCTLTIIDLVFKQFKGSTI